MKTPATERRSTPKGIQPAVLLAYHDDFSIDWNGYQRQIDHALSDPRVTGLLINGHAGECQVTSDEEKAEILKATRAGSPRDVYLTSGVYSESTAFAVRQARQLMDAGADALLIFQPFGWILGCDPNCIVAHHRAIHDAVDLPLMIYQAPVGAGKLAYPVDVLDELMQLERVAGVKEGSWEIKATELIHRQVRASRPDIALYGSGDEHLLYNYFIGTDGSQLSLAAVIPNAVCDLWEAAESGNWDRAKKIHAVIAPLAALIYSAEPKSRAVGRLKACLRMKGVFSSDRMRPPLNQMPVQEEGQLMLALEAVERVLGKR